MVFVVQVSCDADLPILFCLPICGTKARHGRDVGDITQSVAHVYGTAEADVWRLCRILASE